jgi:RimK family alpha-L-glutamate ligase
VVGDHGHGAAILKAKAAGVDPWRTLDFHQSETGWIPHSSRWSSTIGVVRILLVSWRASYADTRLAAAAGRLGHEASIVNPFEAGAQANQADLVLNRLDVRATLDGIEPGLGRLRRLERAGIRVLNRPRAQRAAHDKLVTALDLAREGVPHPDTGYLNGRGLGGAPDLPVVVKPRFGSWGRDVFRCETQADLSACLRGVARRSWFRRDGALLQELVPTEGRDLRILVAGGRVTGAVERRAAPGEWRTNVALGGARRPIEPPEDACDVALQAVSAVGVDLACVDILTHRDGRHVALEVNAAPEFTGAYSSNGTDVFESVLRGLLLAGDRSAARAFARPA